MFGDVLVFGLLLFMWVDDEGNRPWVTAINRWYERSRRRVGLKD